jgi:hypothetical protein
MLGRFSFHWAEVQGYYVIAPAFMPVIQNDTGYFWL